MSASWPPSAKPCAATTTTTFTCAIGHGAAQGSAARALQRSGSTRPESTSPHGDQLWSALNAHGAAVLIAALDHRVAFVAALEGSLCVPDVNRQGAKARVR